jgi:simple sugar transport system permease protein
VAVTEPSGLPRVDPRIAVGERAGAVAKPLATAFVAFVVGALVITASGHDPFSTYWAILKGSGLGWLIPGVGDRADAANDLQQTLLLATALTLVGLAVALPYRCGLFNIGGQGQYLVGWFAAVWIGSSLAGLPGWLHVLAAVLGGSLAGAAWAGIAGLLKATVGAHEVITTIMLNWVAVIVGEYLFGLGGPLHSRSQPFNPVSNQILPDVHLPVFWGDPDLQGLHVGFFVALAALVVFGLTVTRTTLGFELRAVGFNPEAARYGGIGVRRSYVTAMALAGLFGGLAGTLDLLGWKFEVSTADIRPSAIGFLGIAVALLGRNTAVGVFLASVLFAGLVVGTSTRQLDARVFDPRLASNLTLIIQGLIILFVGANVLVLARRRGWRLSRRRGRVRLQAPAGSAHAIFVADVRARLESIVRRLPRGTRAVAAAGIVVGLLAFWLSLPPLTVRTFAAPIAVGLVAVAAGIWAVSRDERRIGWAAVAAGVLGIGGGVLATRSSEANLDTVVVWSALVAATLRFATPLLLAAIGGILSERSGVSNIGLEGMMLGGAFFGIWGADVTGHWTGGLAIAMLAGGLLALLLAFMSIHLLSDQIVVGVAVNVLALGITGYLFVDVYGDIGTPSDVSGIPDVRLPWLEDVYFIGPAIGHLNLMIWIALGLLVVASVFLFRTSLGLRLRAVGEHPGAADTVGISVVKVRYAAVTLSGVLAALGGAYLSIGFVHSFNQNMTAGRGFIALAAVIFGGWRPFGVLGATLLFGFASALALRLPDAYGTSTGTLFQALPYVLTLLAVSAIARVTPPAAVGRPYLRQ